MAERFTPMRCTSESSKVDVKSTRGYWVYTFEPDIRQADLAMQAEIDDLGDDFVKPQMGAIAKTRIVSEGPLNFVAGKLYQVTFHEVDLIPEPEIDIRQTLSDLFGGAQVISLGDLFGAREEAPNAG